MVLDLCVLQMFARWWFPILEFKLLLPTSLIRAVLRPFNLTALMICYAPGSRMVLLLIWRKDGMTATLHQIFGLETPTTGIQTYTGISFKCVCLFFLFSNSQALLQNSWLKSEYFQNVEAILLNSLIHVIVSLAECKQCVAYVY